MTDEQFTKVEAGDILTHVHTGEAYTVLHAGPPHHSVRLLSICNPSEWEKFIKPTGETKATMKTVLWALNQLQGAPGQPNRELVRRFLYAKRWIGPVNLPEEWNLATVPTKKSQLAAIAAELRQYEGDQKSPPNPA